MPAKTSAQLNYSRPLDVHRWSDYPVVNDFVDKIWEQFLAAEFINSKSRGKRAKTPSKGQFKVLLLDLFVAWKEDPELLIGVSLTRSAFRPGSRYNALHISYKIVEVIHYLKKIGLIDMHLGSESPRRVTRIWPTEQLKEIFNKTNFSLLMFRPHEKAEVIILNNKELNTKDELSDKAKPQPYEDQDYAEIPRMREELQRYNELLWKSFIDLQDQETTLYLHQFWNRSKNRRDVRRLTIGHQNKFVKRVFYRGCWLLGGRFHGGFWQQIDKEKRKQIRINDSSTVELDFSGLHLNIAYALEGLQSPSNDPYTVEPLIGYSPEQQRQWLKSLVLVVINAKNEKEAFKAFRSEQSAGSVAKRFSDQKISILLEEFKRKHRPIEHYLCSDKGVRLMNIDGAIVAKVLNHFTNIREPILSVHDSFICRLECKDEVVRVMNEIVSDMLGGYIVGIKTNQNSELLTLKNKGIRLESSQEIENHGLACFGYLSRLKEHIAWVNGDKEF